MDGLRGEYSIAELYRREGISQGVYDKCPKDFMEAGKRRLAGDTARAANTNISTGHVSKPDYVAYCEFPFVVLHTYRRAYGSPPRARRA